VVSNVAGVAFDFGLSDIGVKRIAERWTGNQASAVERGQALFWLRLLLAGVLCASAVIVLRPINSVLLLPAAYLVPLGLTFIGVFATALSGAAGTILQATGQFGRLS